jgi:hypothetical protein
MRESSTLLSKYAIGVSIVAVLIAITGEGARPLARMALGTTGLELIFLACLPWILLSEKLGWPAAVSCTALGTIAVSLGAKLAGQAIMIRVLCAGVIA